MFALTTLLLMHVAHALPYAEHTNLPDPAAYISKT